MIFIIQGFVKLLRVACVCGDPLRFLLCFLHDPFLPGGLRRAAGVWLVASFVALGVVLLGFGAVLCGIGGSSCQGFVASLLASGGVLPGLRGVLAGFRRCPARAVWHHCWLRASFSFERSCLHQKRRIQKQMGNPFRPHDATKRDEQPQHNMHQHDFAADRVRRRTLVPQTGLRCRLFPGYL